MNVLKWTAMGMRPEGIGEYYEKREADRRIAELEALVRRAVASQTVSGGQCHECWAPPGLPHDASCWVGDSIRVLPLLSAMPADHQKLDLYGDCKCAVCLLDKEGKP